MTSERLSLVVRSEVDVQITIYDASGLKQVVGTKQVAARLPRGLYRVHLDRCSFGCDHLILHDAAEEIVLHGPRVESPAPIEIASGSYGHAELARRAPDVAALTEFFDRHNFGPMLRRQAERLALLPLLAAA